MRYWLLLPIPLLIGYVVFASIAGDISGLVASLGWWALLALAWPAFIAFGAWRWSD